LEDCEDKIHWYWNKFGSLLAQDGLIGLPASARTSIVWSRKCFIEDHKIRVLLTESGVATPEDDGPPCYLLYAPRALLKLRSESEEVAVRIVTMCYDREPELVSKHHGKNWALIASIFGGVIDPQHTVRLAQALDF
jgi:hypothetical protein